MDAADRLPAVLATVRSFAAGAGAERVVILLDAEETVLVELSEDGALTVTAGGRTRMAAEVGTDAPLPLPDLRAIPPTAITVDPESGELAAPLGAVQRMADSVLALARACGGRTVATATFATRDAELPLTLAAREGEPIVIDVGGRHFLL